MAFLDENRHRSKHILIMARCKAFQNELKKFMAGHTRRKALIQRLVKAGIWKDQ